MRGPIRRAVVMSAAMGVLLATATGASAASAMRTSPAVVGGDPIIAGPHLALPVGLALDQAGDVFVADVGNGAVYEEVPDGSGGYARTVVAQHLKPDDVAVDGAGNVFVADSGNNRVLEESPAAGGGFTQSVVATGLSNPSGVGVDGSGDLFVADTGSGRVLEEVPAAGGGFTQSVVVTGLSSPTGMAVDSAGDLFIAEPNSGQVVEEAPDGNGYIQTLVASGLDQPNAVALDVFGDVYITEPPADVVVQEQYSGGGIWNQTPTADPDGAPTGVAVDNMGEIFLSVSLPVQGVELGQVQKDYVSIDDTGLLAPASVAVSGSGDVFVAEHGAVAMLTPGGGDYTQSTAVSFGATPALGLAVDASGDLFVSLSSDQVIEETPDGSGGYTQSVVTTGLNIGQPGTKAGVAVDGSGDVFVADTGNDRVVEETPDGSGGYTQSVVASGLSGPAGVAVDGSGDVFVADTGNDRVVEETPDGSGGFTQAVVDDATSGGLTAPTSVAVDASQHLFVLDPQATELVMRDLSTDSHAQAITFSTAPAYYATPDFSPATAESQLPIVYSSTSGQCTIAGNMVHLTGAGSCTVTATQAGGDGWAPATVTQTFPVRKGQLTIAAKDVTVVYGHRPTLHYQLSGFGNGDTVSVMTGRGVCSLDAGTPTDAGTYPGAIICLPGTLSSQNYSVAFKTTGTLTITPAHQVVKFTSKPVHPTYGGSYQVTATGGASGNPVIFSAGATSGPGVCAVSSGTVSFTAAGTCVIDATQAGGQDYKTATAQQFIVVALAKLTVTADAQSRPAGTGNPPFTATITGFVDGQTLATSGVAGAPRCTTTATKTSPPGTYPIHCTLGTLTAPANTYRFAFVAGQLTIT